MREFELIIDEALYRGLRPELTVQGNVQLLHTCIGMRCGRLWLEGYKSLSNPYSGLAYSWPFPQVVTGPGYNLLFVRDRSNLVIYSISDTLTITSVYTIDEAAFGQGTRFDVADFGLYLYMTNGVRTIEYDVASGSFSSDVGSSHIPLLSTVCNFKGQMVGGNVKNAWYDCDERYYVWSRIGHNEFRIDRAKDAGYRIDIYGGTIYHTKKLQNIVVGYSSEGVMGLFPHEYTFGFTEMHDVGVINKGAVGASDNRHIYVGSDYNLYEVTKEGVKELGYQQYMQQLGEIVINYDPSEKDFYISDGSKTFLLSPFGLTELNQHPSAVFKIGEETYCIPDGVSSNEALIITSPFDMGYRGQKTVFSIETDLMDANSKQVAIDYTYESNSWKTTDYKPINNQGIASIIASSNDFRFRLNFIPIGYNSRVSYIRPRFKMTDLRGIRGVYAPPPRGQ